MSSTTRSAEPPAGARSRLPPRERRALIVAAAAEAFGRSGYDATTLDEIAAAAGVTKPILYRHFSSKRDLYLALLRIHRDDLSRFLAGEAGGQPSLPAILDGWLDYARRNSHGWRMLFRDRGGGPEVAAFRRVVEDRARDVLVDWFRVLPRAPIPEEQLEPTAELVRAGLAGLVLWWIDHPEAPRAALAGAAERLLAPLVAGD